VPLTGSENLDALCRFVGDENRSGAVLVGRIAKAVQDLLGAKTDVAFLSDYTAAKQVANHPDLTSVDYRLAPLVLAEPTVVLPAGDRHLILLRAGDRIIRAIVKVTPDGEEVFMQSFHFVRRKEVRRLLRQRRALFGGSTDILG
jgi:hypothetical protein